MNAESAITEITTESFEQQVLHSELPVLVAVCARDSRASQKFLSRLESWKAETSGRMKLVRVNLTTSPGVARRCGMSGAPGCALFRLGSVSYQFTGELSRHEWDDLLAQTRRREATDGTP